VALHSVTGFDTLQMRPTPVIGLSAALLAFALLFSSVLGGLWQAWSTDDNYSHGFLIVPIAAYLTWERRSRLLAAAPRPSALGLAAILASLATLTIGTLGAEQFLTRLSLIGVLTGSVLFVLGSAHLRVLLFPLAFLLLMIPIPAIVFNQIAFPLQLLASQTGQAGLQALHIPVLREGNMIFLASTTLEVAEACSGIRSLVSLLTLAIVFGYLVDSRLWVRGLLAACTIPIAVAANGLRVAGIGFVAHHYGSEAAEGFMHTFSGWLVFLVAFAMLLLVYRIVAWLAPQRAVIRPTMMEEEARVVA
jgi:exosortase